MTSRYQLLRRFAAPVALAVAIALLLQETCRQGEQAEVGFAVELGDAAPEVRHVRVDLDDGGEPIAWFERRFDAEGAARAPRWRQVVPERAIDATIAVTLASGETYVVRRRIHAPPGSEVVLDARPGRP